MKFITLVPFVKISFGLHLFVLLSPIHKSILFHKHEKILNWYAIICAISGKC